MITDRQRVEMTLFPMLMMDVLINGVDDPASDEAKQTQNLLWLATRGVIMDLGMREQKKIMRRTKRAHEAVLGEYRDGEASIAKVSLFVFYVIQAVTDCDYLVVPDDAPLRQALDMMMPSLLEAVEVDRINASAKEGARKALKLLQEMGYFDGVASLF